MKELSSKQVAQMSRAERVKTAKAYLKGLTREQRRKVCAEIPEICSFLEGKTDSCSTSCDPRSTELAELNERIQSLASELRRVGVAMQQKRRDQLKTALAQLDLMELYERQRAEEAQEAA